MVVAAASPAQPPQAAASSARPTATPGVSAAAAFGGGGASVAPGRSEGGDRSPASVGMEARAATPDVPTQSEWALETPRNNGRAAAGAVGGGKGEPRPPAGGEEEARGLATPATERDSDSIDLSLDGEEEEGATASKGLRLGRRLSRRAISLVGTEATASSSSWGSRSEGEEDRDEGEEDHDAERRLAQRLRLAKKKWEAETQQQQAADGGSVPTASCFPAAKLLLLKPRRPAYAHVQLPLERLEPYLREYGTRSMAYGHLHKAQRHFEVPGLGVVSYCWVRSLLGRAAFVIGDPLAAPASMPALLQRFHATVPGMKLYVAVSEAVASALRPMGWSATVFGNDYYGDIAQWKAPKSRRRYLNEGNNAGLVVEELSHDELTEAERARVAEISRLWLEGKTGFGGELQMMTHPFRVEDEWCIRKFYAFDKPRAQGGKLLAYIFFTPCFRGGHVAGWNANVLRRDTTMEGTKNEGTKNVLDFLLLHCDKTFRAEKANGTHPNLEFLSLSFSPMYGLAKHPGDSRYLRKTFRLWYNLPSRLYSKAGLGRHKDHFKMNRVEKTFVCARGPGASLAVQELILTVTNLVPIAKWRHGISSD